MALCPEVICISGNFNMALGPDWVSQSWCFLWIFTLLLSESQTKKTQTCKYYISFIGMFNIFSQIYRFYIELIFSKLLTVDMFHTKSIVFKEWF